MKVKTKKQKHKYVLTFQNSKAAIAFRKNAEKYLKRIMKADLLKIKRKKEVVKIEVKRAITPISFSILFAVSKYKPVKSMQEFF